MSDDLFDELMKFAILGISFSLIFAVIALFAVTITGYGCKDQAEMMNMKYKFSISTGCIDNTNDIWVPVNSLVPVDKDGKIVYTSKYRNRFEIEAK